MPPQSRGDTTPPARCTRRNPGEEAEGQGQGAPALISFKLGRFLPPAADRRAWGAPEAGSAPCRGCRKGTRREGAGRGGHLGKAGGTQLPWPQPGLDPRKQKTDGSSLSWGQYSEKKKKQSMACRREGGEGVESCCCAADAGLGPFGCIWGAAGSRAARVGCGCTGSLSCRNSGALPGWMQGSLRHSHSKERRTNADSFVKVTKLGEKKQTTTNIKSSSNPSRPPRQTQVVRNVANCQW